MIKAQKEFKENWSFMFEYFDDLMLKPQLLRNIYKLFTRPTNIQSKVIMALLKMKDVFVRAWSESGKTIAFIIAMLQMIDPEIQNCQALVIASDSEQAQSLQQFILYLAEGLDVNVGLYTEDKIRTEGMNQIPQDFHIIVTTSLVACDMINMSYLEIHRLRLVVFDGLDVILENGYQDNARKILASTDKDVQIAFVASKTSPEIHNLVEEFMQDPTIISLKDCEATIEGVSQYYMDCGKEEWKFESLIELLNHLDVNHYIIYCNTQQTAEELTIKLNEQNLDARDISYRLNQSQRDLVLREFRSYSFRILVVADVIIRGLDHQPVPLIISYDFPSSKELYVARFGHRIKYRISNFALSLITSDEDMLRKEIEESFKTDISPLPFDLEDLFRCDYL